MGLRLGCPRRGRPSVAHSSRAWPRAGWRRQSVRSGSDPARRRSGRGRVVDTDDRDERRGQFSTSATTRGSRPRSAGRRPVVIHSRGTHRPRGARSRRSRRCAAARPHLVMLDADRDEAEAGSGRGGHGLRPGEMDRQWPAGGGSWRAARGASGGPRSCRSTARQAARTGAFAFRAARGRTARCGGYHVRSPHGSRAPTGTRAIENFRASSRSAARRAARFSPNPEVTATWQSKRSLPSRA